jgi:hypothetical protein
MIVPDFKNTRWCACPREVFAESFGISEVLSEFVGVISVVLDWCRANPRVYRESLLGALTYDSYRYLM